MKNMRFFLPVATAVLLTAAAAVSFARGAESLQGRVAVTAAWARATPPGATIGAAYATLENKGGADDRIVSISSPVARSVVAHETMEENGVAMMRPLDRPLLPAGGVLEMRPGGIHLMLMGLTGPLKEGNTLPITFGFEHASELTVSAEVAPIGADAPVHHDHAM